MLFRSGDAAFQRKCITKMENVARNDGRTVLFVSHQMSAVRRLCTHGLYLEDGQADGIISVPDAIQRYNALPERMSYSVTFPSQNLPVEIRSVECLTPPTYGEELRVQIELFATQPLRQVSVGMGFDSQEGHRVLTLDCDNASSLIDLPAGRSFVELSLPFNPLSPTSYSCTVGILQGLHPLDIRHNFTHWDVIAGPRDTNSERGAAGCRPVVKTTVKAAELLCKTPLY